MKNTLSHKLVGSVFSIAGLAVVAIGTFGSQIVSADSVNLESYDYSTILIAAGAILVVTALIVLFLTLFSD